MVSPLFDGSNIADAFLGVNLFLEKHHPSHDAPSKEEHGDSNRQPKRNPEKLEYLHGALPFRL
jgi:hypothetical protein